MEYLNDFLAIILGHKIISASVYLIVGLILVGADERFHLPVNNVVTAHESEVAQGLFREEPEDRSVIHR